MAIAALGQGFALQEMEKMAIERWSPFSEMRRFDDIFGRMLRGSNFQETPESWSIPLDVTRNGDAVTVKASLPGVNKEDVDVTIEDNVLTIRAEIDEENEKQEIGYLLKERRTGSFYRAVRLPDAVDSEEASSTYSDGVLKITLPKTEEKKARKLAISG